MTILNYSLGPAVVSLSHLAAAFSSNVVCRVVLGTKFEGYEISVKFWEIVTEFMYLMGVFNVGDFVTWLAWLNHLNGVNARIEKNKKNLDRIFESVIQYQRGGSGGVEDFVNVLLHIEKDGSLTVSFDRDSIKAMLLSASGEDDHGKEDNGGGQAAGDEDDNDDANIDKDEPDRNQTSRRLSSLVDWKSFFGYRCYFEDLIKGLSFFSSKFDNETFEIMMRSPFGDFFNAIMKGKISRGMVEKCSYSIVDIVGMYTGQGNGFRFKKGGEVVNLNPEEVSLLFGLPLKGEVFDTREKKRIMGRFEAKYFKKSKRITKKELSSELESLLNKKIKTQSDREDIVKLVILYSFATFFFASTNGGVAKNFLRKFESFEYMNSFSWPRIIHNFLMKSIKTYYKKPASVSGCVTILLYFLAEHTNVIEPIKNSKNSRPRVTRWNLAKMTGENWPDTFGRLTKAQVNVEMKGLTSAEIALLSLSGGQVMEKKYKDDAKNGDVEENEADVVMGSLDPFIDPLNEDIIEGEVQVTNDHGVDEDIREENCITDRERGSMDMVQQESMFAITDLDKEGNEDLHFDDLLDVEKRLKFLFEREKRVTERLRLRISQLEEAQQEKPKDTEKEQNVKELFCSELEKMRDYYEKAEQIYHRDNKRIERCFAEYVDAHDMETASNKKVRADLVKQIEQLNDAYSSQTKIVQELIKEKNEASARERKLIHELLVATAKKFDMHVEETIIDQERNEVGGNETQEPILAAEGLRANTADDVLGDTAARGAADAQQEDKTTEEVLGSENVVGNDSTQEDTIKKLIVEAQFFRIQVNEKETAFKRAQEECLTLRNQMDTLLMQKNENYSELMLIKEKSNKLCEENEVLRKQLDVANKKLNEQFIEHNQKSVLVQDKMKNLEDQNQRIILKLAQQDAQLKDYNRMFGDNSVLKSHYFAVKKMLNELQNVKFDQPLNMDFQNEMGGNSEKDVENGRLSKVADELQHEEEVYVLKHPVEST